MTKESILLNCGVGRRLLRVPCIARRLNQSILKEITPEYSLEGLTLKLKLQYFGHLTRRANSSEKTLMLGRIEGMRRRGAMENEMVRWHHRLNGHEFEQTLGYSEGQRSLACCSPWGHSQTQPSDRTVLRIQWEYTVSENTVWKMRHFVSLYSPYKVGYHTNN